MTVGERLKSLRIQKGLSQVEFADKINVSKQTLYKYENNIITNIPSDKIEASAEILNTTPAFLMGWEDAENRLFSYWTRISEINKEKHLIELYRKLNSFGRNEAVKRVEELACLPQYQESAPVAAHERTDTEVTEEMIQHDNDIMNGDDF